MIFVMLGTQKEQFERIIDYVVKSKTLINDQIIIQKGNTKYNKEYDKSRIEMFDFINDSQFLEYVKSCEFIITHGGVGSIFSGLLNEKKVLAIPRLKKYDEHVDDHQIEICEKLEKLKYILSYNEEKEGTNLFDDKIEKLKSMSFEKYISDKSFLDVLYKQI